MTPARRILNWRAERGILRFVDEQFHAELDPWQEEALLAFASPDPDKMRISLQACAGPGKSAVLAMAGWWFLGCQGDVHEHPKGAALSYTSDNLKDNLWAEFAKWQAISEYLKSQFTWTSRRIFSNDHPETWFLSARAWPKTASADEQGKTLSGLHSKYPFVLADESGAIPPTVLRAAEQAMSRAFFGKIMQAGNPISLQGMLYAAAQHLRDQWYVIKITGDPKDRGSWVNSPRIKREYANSPEPPWVWAAKQIKTYGRDNPWVMSYILGQFPPSSLNALLGIEEVEAAMKRQYRADEFTWAQKRIGIDVARFGDDRTVLFPRQGLQAFKPATMRNARTTAIAARAQRAAQRWGCRHVFVDDTGHWGHGVIDNLATYAEDSGLVVIPVIYHQKATSPRYYNMRSQIWMELAEWVKKGGALPYIPGLVAELTEPTYTFKNGAFWVEEKDLVKKRLGRSPDEGDALANTFAIPDMPGDELPGGGRRRRKRQEVEHEFDPFQDPRDDDGGNRAEFDFDPFKGS